ncbi:MAG: OmpL47-type beta-barrel domain-containing protein, partial [Actinomycetota bacterium]
TGGTGLQLFKTTGTPPQNIGIRYKDVVAPVVSSVVPACNVAGTNDWCLSATNTVTITDNNDGSGNAQGVGVKSRTFTVDGGAPISYTSGSPASVSFGEGTHVLAAKALDWANNNSSTVSGSIKVDTTPPVLTASPSCSQNGNNGWCRGTLSLNLAASDATSGIASQSCTVDGSPVSCGSLAIDPGTHTGSVTATDNAGNSASTSVIVKVDTDTPIITAARDPEANANGWANVPVVVTFTCSDATSGIDTCTPPVTLGEGATQSAAGTAVDIAGNDASTTIADVNVDLTAPSIAGAVTSDPNGAGWYRDDVGVAWTCSDELSGLDGDCPANSTIIGEGDNLSATQLISDLAGNTSFATVDNIKIDRTAPVTDVSAPNGWIPVDAVVTLTPTDNLSGIASTEYSVDGGDFQQGTEVIITSEGEHTIAFRSTDLADNVEETKDVTVKVDKSAPAITHTLDPVPNANLWNRDDTTVSFQCSDAVSGIASCSGDTTITDEGLDQEVTGTAEDLAGNTTPDTAIVNLDRTAPDISATRVQEANGNGWSNEPVVVTFTCLDGLSGIASCPDAITLGEGAGQTASGTAVDAADNSSPASISGINVDLTPPTISGAITTAIGQDGWYTGDVNVHWTCTEVLSGVTACPADSTISGEGEGLSATETISDLAGNTASTTVTVKIDRTAPGISYSGQTPAANGNGWNNSAVTLTWACTDALSGANAASVTQTVTGDTAGTAKTGTCTDAAGNSASNTQGPIRLDRSPPSAAIDSPGVVPVISIATGGELTGTASDALSGIDTVMVTLVDAVAGGTRTLPAECVSGCAGGTAITWRIKGSDIGIGIYAATAVSADRASNASPATLPVLFVVTP